MARFRSGAPGVFASFGKLRPTASGEKLGDEYIASTRPVAGSIATTAPTLPAMPAAAARCAGTDRLVTTLSPVTVSPWSSEPTRETTVARSLLEAVR